MLIGEGGFSAFQVGTSFGTAKAGARHFPFSLYCVFCLYSDFTKMPLVFSFNTWLLLQLLEDYVPFSAIFVTLRTRSQSYDRYTKKVQDICVSRRVWRSRLANKKNDTYHSLFYTIAKNIQLFLHSFRSFVISGCGAVRERSCVKYGDDCEGGILDVLMTLVTALKKRATHQTFLGERATCGDARLESQPPRGSGGEPNK